MKSSIKNDLQPSTQLLNNPPISYLNCTTKAKDIYKELQKLRIQANVLQTAVQAYCRYNIM